ncbi:MAG: cell division protein FtsX [Candidatus Xenobia bacterium]|jgi:cell division transport system permease protein
MGLAHYFLREVLVNVRRSPLMSVASVTTVMVLTMIVGFFLVLMANLSNLARDLASDLKVVAYLEADFNRDQLGELRARVLRLPGVEGVSFVSREQAFEHLKKRMNNRIQLGDLTHNPLPDALEIRVRRAEDLEKVGHKVKGVGSIEKVRFGEDVARRMLALNRIVRTVGLVVLILLLVSTLLVVSNTIRLTVYARRRDIEVMQLVGAAGWFIRWPFLLEGILQGLVGAALAATVVSESYRLLVPQLLSSVSFLPVAAPESLLPWLCPALLLLGALVGLLGSWISVNRFLKV